MDEKKNAMECALCGYKASGEFVGDICPECGLTYWRCSSCGYTITAPSPPELCPECKENAISKISLAILRNAVVQAISIHGCNVDLQLLDSMRTP